MDQQILFIDFEFTMPNGKKRERGFVPEIIEIGLVSVRNNEIYDTFSSYVKPVRSPILTDFCKSFLSISQRDVNKGIDFHELVDWIDAYYIPEKTSIVTWGNMDMKVLKENCRHVNIPCPLPGKERDLSLEHMRFYGDRNQTGLWKALQEYGADRDGKHHRALDDALTTYEVYKRVEKDRSYMQAGTSWQPSLGDRINLMALKQKLA